MITAYELSTVLKELENAKSAAQQMAPNATFVFIGIERSILEDDDNLNIYFNVVAKESEIKSDEIRDLKEKTRFEILEENYRFGYIGRFKMEVMS